MSGKYISLAALLLAVPLLSGQIAALEPRNTGAMELPHNSPEVGAQADAGNPVALKYEWQEQVRADNDQGVEAAAHKGYRLTGMPSLYYSTGVYYVSKGLVGRAYVWFKVSSLLGHGAGTREAFAWEKNLPGHGFDTSALDTEAEAIIAGLEVN